MKTVKAIQQQMECNPYDIPFSDPCAVCEYHFGKPRQTGTSHKIYKTPWQGDPRINIQNEKGKAKPYQVKQVLKAIEKLKSKQNDES